MKEKKDSVYSKCSECIAIAEEQQKLILKTEKIADNVLLSINLGDMSREELERKYAKAVIAVCLADHGYRSVVPGYGYYVNWEACTNPIYMKRLIDNAEQDEEAKRLILAALQKDNLQKYAKGLMKVPRGQMRIAVNGEMYTEPTFEELIEMLEADMNGDK